VYNFSFILKKIFKAKLIEDKKNSFLHGSSMLNIPYLQFLEAISIHYGGTRGI